MSDKIIAVTAETERRHMERRASDRDLSARVSALEAVASEYRKSIALQEKIQRERRYALLQAAATVYGSGGTYRLEGKWMRVCTVESAVGEAEMLLAEIEKREQERQS